MLKSVWTSMPFFLKENNGSWRIFFNYSALWGMGNYIIDPKSLWDDQGLIHKFQVIGASARIMWHWEKRGAIDLVHSFEAKAWLFSVCINIPCKQGNTSKSDNSFTKILYGFSDLRIRKVGANGYH